MSDHIRLSIIIVSFNTKELTLWGLRSVFDSLKSKPFGYEVIVVDNNSNDGSIGAIAKEFPLVNLIKNSKNRGYGAANNQAVREAKGELILLLNSDIVVLDNAIE